jgi:hypothetical protein
LTDLQPGSVGHEEVLGTEMSEPKKPNNLRTALILGSVALMFFVGLFVNRIWFV